MSKNNKINSYFSKRNLIIWALAVLVVVQFITVQTILGNFNFLKGNNGSFLKELGQMREAYSLFGDDLSEVRNYLRLPDKKYESLFSSESNEDEKNDKQLQLAMFRFVSHLSSSMALSENMKKSKAAFEELVSNEDFLKTLSDNGLTHVRKDLGLKVSNENDLLFKIYVDSDGRVYRSSMKDATVAIEFDDAAGLVSKLTQYVLDSKDELVNHLNSLREKVDNVSALLSSESIQKSLQSLSLRSDMTPTEQADSYVFTVYGKLDTALAEIIVDKGDLKISLIDKANSKFSLQPSNLAESLVPFLKKLDNKTFTERKYIEALEEIEDTLDDRGFKLLLKESNLSMGENRREDEARVFFDIFDVEGALINSIVLEKATGLVNVVDSKGANSENLLLFDPSSKKKL